MYNPWLDIPSDDYEDHMNAAGQLSIIGDELKKSLIEFKPESLLLPGAATGNGLEHINPNITKNIFAVDINPQYLEILRKRFVSKLSGLQTYVCDIEIEMPLIPKSDMIFAALLFEYVDPVRTLYNLSSVLKNMGTMIVILQKTGNSSFVTNTGYKSIQTLAEFANEVDVEYFISIANSSQLVEESRMNIPVGNSKYFVKLVLKRDN